jgi:hypothetical protein
MEKWFEFTAYNSQAAHGFGTEEEASKYCDILNRSRDVNQYHYREMEGNETAALDSGDDTDGFRLDLELDAQDEQNEQDEIEF